MKIGDIVKIEIYPEICCELCNDIIHNHFDCPVCSCEYADSENYGELEKDDVLVCGRCGSQFSHESEYWYDG